MSRSLPAQFVFSLKVRTDQLVDNAGIDDTWTGHVERTPMPQDEAGLQIARTVPEWPDQARIPATIFNNLKNACSMIKPCSPRMRTRAS